MLVNRVKIGLIGIQIVRAVYCVNVVEDKFVLVARIGTRIHVSHNVLVVSIRAL